MDMSHSFLAGIWFFIIGGILFLYVSLDGFDLGIGMLSLVSKKEAYRSAFMQNMGPSWHANQTWLVVLGGVLFGAFPLVYSLALSTLYIPIMAMLFGLIMRGVGFEFREEAEKKIIWDLSFGIGSLITGLSQGFVLGVFLTGLRMEGGRFAGGAWVWLNPLGTLVALALVFLYLLLGATYLVIKTSGEIQRFGYRAALAVAPPALLSTLGTFLWAFSIHPNWADRWLVWPGLLATSVPLILAVLGFIMVIRSLFVRRQHAPFLWTVLTLAFSATSLTASVYPYVVLPSLTITAAAAPPITLKVMLTVIGFVLPVMMIYNAYQYRIFRGKVGEP